MTLADIEVEDSQPSEPLTSENLEPRPGQARPQPPENDRPLPTEFQEMARQVYDHVVSLPEEKVMPALREQISKYLTSGQLNETGLTFGIGTLAIEYSEDYRLILGNDEWNQTAIINMINAIAEKLSTLVIPEWDQGWDARIDFIDKLSEILRHSEENPPILPPQD